MTLSATATRSPAAPVAPPPAEPRWRTASRKVAVASGVILLAASLSALGAFASHWTAALQLRPWMPPVASTTAVAVGALGAALLGLVTGHRRVTNLAAALVLALVVATVVEYATGVRLVSGRFGTGYLEVGTTPKTHMAQNVALALTLVAAPLLATRHSRLRRHTPLVLNLAGAVVAGIAVLSLFGYATGLSGAYAWGTWTPMALQTAVALVVLGIGLGAAAACASPASRVPTSLATPSVMVLAMSLSLLGWHVMADLLAALGHRRTHAQAVSSVLTASLTTLVLGLSFALAMAAIRGRREAQQTAALLRTESEQRARAEREQRDAARRLQQLVHSAPDGILLVDGSGQLRLVNPELERMLGYDPCELDGRTVEAVVPERFGGRHVHLREGYIAHPTTRPMGTGRDLWARRKDGSELPVEVSLSSLSWQGETLALAFVRDVTQAREMRELQRRWWQVVQNAEWGVVLGSADGERLELVNPAFARMHGFEVDELVGGSLLDVFAPEVRAGVPEHIRTADELGHHTFESLHVRRDGSVFPVLVDVTAVRNDEGEVLYRIANVQDISFRRRSEDLLRAQRWVLEAIARGEPLEDSLQSIVALVEARLGGGHGLVHVQARGVPHEVPVNVTVSTGNDQVRWLVQPGLADTLAALSDEPVSVVDLAAPEIDPGLRAAARAAGVPALWCARIKATTRQHVTGVLLLTRPDTRPPAEDETMVLEAAAQLARLAAKRTMSDAELTHQALHDALTGLPNRQLFFDRLAHITSARGDRTTAVLYIDLDRFKVINDSLGHDAGDQLLVNVASRLRETMRPSDTLARLGGDEFAVLAEDENHALDTAMLARRILETLRRPLTIAGRELRVTASIGAVIATPGSDPVDLLRHADAAMYRAKAAGGGRLEVFDDQLRGQLITQMEHEQALRAGLDADEFVPVYQPIRDVQDGTPLAFEALARWRRADGWLATADTFVPMAEEAGLIVELDERILRRACVDAATWPATATGVPPRVHVNLSATSLARLDLVALVNDTLRHSRLPAARLCVELTETAAMRDVEASVATLRRLRELGVRVALDDFGTGQASLNYLEMLPVDEVKIDRQFVQGLQDSPVRYRIVQAVVTIADTLGMEVTAEGIESPEQLAAVGALGVQQVQGYLLGRPAVRVDPTAALPSGVVVEAKPVSALPQAFPRPRGGERQVTS